MVAHEAIAVALICEQDKVMRRAFPVKRPHKSVRADMNHITVGQIIEIGNRMNERNLEVPDRW